MAYAETAIGLKRGYSDLRTASSQQYAYIGFELASLIFILFQELLYDSRNICIHERFLQTHT